ncbi:ER lumen protein retaining receptor [Platanthera guangdongensis]|uniref:ER lumen protein retaining receptor n=1 Tax=Platanthera guangdongensis TaxID=2320717 RepID=A0ABR2M3V1_9ASPA
MGFCRVRHCTKTGSRTSCEIPTTFRRLLATTPPPRQFRHVDRLRFRWSHLCVSECIVSVVLVYVSGRPRSGRSKVTRSSSRDHHRLRIRKDVSFRGAYRAFYILNWIYRYLAENHYSRWISWVAGIVQTALYLDFFYYYFIRSAVAMLAAKVKFVTDTLASKSKTAHELLRIIQCS